MSIEFYLTENTLAGKKGFIPQTLHIPAMSTDELIRRMAEVNASVAGPAVRGMLSLLEETILSALLHGRAVQVGGILKLTPMVTGNLPGEDLRQADNNPDVRISCRIDAKFLHAFKNRVKLVRVKGSGPQPQLSRPVGKRVEINAVYPATLRGVDLKMKYYDLSGVTLKRQGKRYVSVPVSRLVVLRHTISVFSFHFTGRFTPPDWLSDGCEITIALDYIHKKDGRTRQSDALPAVWRKGTPL